MMKLYTVKDVKIGGFADPFCLQNNMVALRAFGDAVNDPKSNISRHPEDQELWLLGTFDQETGEIISQCEFIAKGIDYVDASKKEI